MPSRILRASTASICVILPTVSANCVCEVQVTMKCLILAAGYATRLYPLTKNFPKPLLKVGEKTILDWLLEDIHTRC